MHIDFNLGLQQLGVSSRRKFYPEQIDEILNLIVDQFVQDSVKEVPSDQYFHRVQVDVDRVKTLLIRDYVLDVNQQASFNSGTRKASVQLPADYAYLISDNLGLTKDCGQATSNTSEYITTVAVKNVTLANPYTKYFSVFKLSSFLSSSETVLVDTDTDTRQGEDSAIYTGFPAATDRSYAMRLLWDLFQEKFRAGIIGNTVKGLYWERYGKIYKPNNFILVTTNNITKATVTINGNTSDYSPVTQAVSRITGDPTYNSSRLTRASVVDTVLTTPFMRPLKHSPVSLIADNEFIVYTPENIIVTKAVLTYLRKPSKISVSLHRNCELPEEFHGDIVEKAIQYAAGKIEQMPLFAVQEKETTK